MGQRPALRNQKNLISRVSSKVQKIFVANALVRALAFSVFMDVFDIERPFSITLCYGFAPDFTEKERFCPYYSARYQPSQAGVPVILIQIVSRPGSGAYLKSLWQRCHRVCKAAALSSYGSIIIICRSSIRKMPLPV